MKKMLKKALTWDLTTILIVAVVTLLILIVVLSLVNENFAEALGFSDFLFFSRGG